ncbi:MAG: hypothetical protein AAGC43_05870 [Bacteroidota bacterium]
MENFEFFYLTSGVISTIFQLVVIVATGMLFFKKRNLASGLMFFGSLFTVLFYGFSLLGNTLMAYDGAESVVKFNAIFGIVSQIPHILFALGLLFFAIQHLKREAAHKNI